MSSNWPPEGGAGSNAGGYGADDFGIDPDYPSDGTHYGNGTDQDSRAWPGAPQSYTYADDDSSGYGIAAYEGDPRGQTSYPGSHDSTPYGPSSDNPNPYYPNSDGSDAYGANSHNPNSYGSDPYGANTYGADAYGANSSSPSPYGSIPGGQNSYGPESGALSPYDPTPSAPNSYDPASGSPSPYAPTSDGPIPYNSSADNSSAYGRNSYDQGGYGQDPYGRTVRGTGSYYQAPYGETPYGDAAYGETAYGGTPAAESTYSRPAYRELTSGQNGDYALDGSGQDSQAQNGYGRSYRSDGYSANGQPAYDQPASQSAYDQPAYDQPAYDQPGSGPAPATGQDGYYYGAGTQGGSTQNGSTQNGSDALDNGTRGQAANGRGSFSLPSYTERDGGPDSYGRDLYAQEGYGSARSYRGPADPDATSAYQRPPAGSVAGPDTGFFGPVDTGSFARPDTDSFGRPDAGPAARPDAGSFAQRDAGSLDFGDSGVFARPGAASFDEPDSEAFPRSDTGSFGRAEGGAYGRSSSVHGNGRTSGYEPWHDADDDGDGWEGDESDGDWHDEGDSSLLSRRFGDEDDDPGDSGGRGSHGRKKKTKRPRRARNRIAVLASILVAALVVGAIGEYGYHVYSSWHTSRYGDYAGAGTGKVQFVVPQNAALSGLGPALVKAGVIEEVRPFVGAAAAANGANTLQPGVYILHHHMSAADAVSYLLSSGHRLSDTVTIIEGMRASKIAQILAAKTHLPVSQFTELIDHPSQLGLPSWASGAKTAEGFLFPDTYDILPNESPLKILRAMVTEFNNQADAIGLVSEAKKVNTDAWHILIVASMVQAEAGSPQDFGKIARVVWNRLAMKMPLEFDSTVFYAMGTYGTAITKAEESYKSPYNTYANVGLPPGPIGNPGIAAINATLHPPHGGWLYFITDTRHKPYITYFTSSLTQLQQWQATFGN